MKRLGIILLFTLLVVAAHAQFNLSWVDLTAPTGTSQLIGNASCADAAGNVYTAGHFLGTIDFDPGPGTFTMASASTATNGNQTLFICKETTTGTFLWSKQITAITGYVFVQAITTDTAGNIYIAGAFTDITDFDPGVGTYTLPVQNGEMFIVKLSASGTFLWAKNVGGSNGVLMTMTPNGSVFPNYISTDANGNLCVACSFNGTVDLDPGPSTFTISTTGYVYNVAVFKLDASGNFIWAKSFNTNDLSFIQAQQDAAGNVYVAGTYSGTSDFDPGPGVFNMTSAGLWDVFICKLDGSGNFVWGKSVGGTGDDHFYALALDASANVFATGYFTGTGDFDPGAGITTLTSAGGKDVFILKLDAAGSFAWAKSIGSGNASGSAANDEYGTYLAADGAGNVYTAGNFASTVDFDPGPGVYTLTPVGLINVFIIRLDASGSFVWAGQLGGAAGASYVALNTDALTNLYIAGNSFPSFDYDPGPATFTLPVTSTVSQAFYAEKICQWPTQAPLSTVSSSICQGAAGNFSIAGVSGATSYSWALPVGWSGASATTSIHTTPLSSGTMSVSITFSGCGQGVEEVSVTVLPLPLVSATSGSICAGQSYTLVCFGGLSYTIQGGTSVVSPGISTTYTVVGLGGNGCLSVPYTASVAVSPTPAVTAGSGSICAGNAFTIVPSGAAATYSLSSGSQIVTPSVTSSYSVTGTSSAGCSSAPVVVTVTVVNLPLPVVVASSAATISCAGQQVTLTASGASTYSWSNGGNTATILTTPTLTSSYTVTGTDANGCYNTASVTQVVTSCTGLQEAELESDVSVFPNPGTDKMTIQIISSQREYVLRVFNLAGEQVVERELNGRITTITPVGLANGIYLLQVIRNGSVIRNIKWIKN